MERENERFSYHLTKSWAKHRKSPSECHHFRIWALIFCPPDSVDMTREKDTLLMFLHQTIFLFLIIIINSFYNFCQDSFWNLLPLLELPFILNEKDTKSCCWKYATLEGKENYLFFTLFLSFVGFGGSLPSPFCGRPQCHWHNWEDTQPVRAYKRCFFFPGNFWQYHPFLFAFLAGM